MTQPSHSIYSLMLCATSSITCVLSYIHRRCLYRAINVHHLPTFSVLFVFPVSYISCFAAVTLYIHNVTEFKQFNVIGFASWGYQMPQLIDLYLPWHKSHMNRKCTSSFALYNRPPYLIRNAKIVEINQSILCFSCYRIHILGVYTHRHFPYENPTTFVY